MKETDNNEADEMKQEVHTKDSVMHIHYSNVQLLV